MMRQLLGAFAVAGLVLAGCANGNDSASDNGRLIEVSMRDNRFDPSTISVKKGETVTLRFTNAGSAIHEALVGDERAQMAHADEMMSETTMMDSDGMGGMHHDGADDAISVKPGGSMDMTRTFDESGALLIGCHVSGHYESGMKATIEVS